MNPTSTGCFLFFLLPFFGAGAFVLQAGLSGLIKGKGVARLA